MHALHAARSGRRLALVDAHRTLDYAQANAEIDAIAAGLRDHVGVSSRAPVAVMMENRVEYAVLWFALFRLGVPCVHLSCFGTESEAVALVQRSGAGVLVASARTDSVASAVAARVAGLRVVRVDGEGPLGYPSLRRRGAGSRVCGASARSQNVVYTSGTTGQPKGAVRNFGSLGLTTLLEILERLPLRSGDRHLVVAPLYHSGAQAFALVNAALGSTLVLQDKFDAPETLRWMHEQPIDTAFLVPTMIQRLLELPDAAFDRYPPRLRALVSGAAPFLDPLRRRAIARFGAAAVFDFYGATELGWVTLVSGEEMLARPGTLGRAISGQEIAIFGDDGRMLPAGSVGTVFSRSGQRMEGYLDDPESTAQTERGDWVTVDDLGRLDPQGYLFLTGRARDMVISGGMNIYPVEVEQALLEHEAIAEVAVIGICDERWGEGLVACCVGDAQPSDELEAWSKARLSAYKVPRRWVWMDALPRNPTGKVLKRQLVKALEA